jgi:hypothetical protein
MWDHCRVRQPVVSKADADERWGAKETLQPPLQEAANILEDCGRPSEGAEEDEGFIDVVSRSTAKKASKAAAVQAQPRKGGSKW